jgi:type I restriction enzyme R subunit
MLERVEQNDPQHDTARHGGIVWHTQGSGKSLTMVMFVRALIEHSRIINPRVIIVTDRVDLDKQIAETFRNCNLKKKVTRVKSGQHLLDLIRDQSLDVITTLVHKFEAASKKKVNFIDESRDIFVLVDEAHRTQSGIAHAEMRKFLPNACYIGFTGTPLMKKERASYLTFGDYIDKYTIDDALKDEVILPLIYEGRYVELTQNREQIDRRVERLTENLDEKDKNELQRYVDSKVIKDNPQRIAEIAFDVEKHYVQQFQGSGLKAQLVAPSKFSAVLFQKYFEQNNLIRSALVISDEDGKVSDEDTHRKAVVEYLKKMSERYSSLASYETAVIDDFKHNEEGVELLIVVDKLLTGFDAPCNTVLYLAKDLCDHNLLQAIARVNRLFENEKLPKTSGFIIDYSENAKNLDTAMKLFGNFDEDDVKGTLIDVQDKIKELEDSYAAVHELFKDLKGSKDSEAFLGALNDEADRRGFYDALNEFVAHFKECLVLRDFVHEFKHVDVYAKELKKLLEIRKASQLRYADRVDLEQYKKAIIDILDQYVDATGVELLTKQVNITDPERFKEAIDALGSDRSKAEAIAAQTERVINDRLEKDPEFYKRFSDKISDLITQMREGRIADLEALGQMKLFRDEVLNKHEEGSPEKIARRAGADVFYRNLKQPLASLGLSDAAVIDLTVGMMDVLAKEVIVDWYQNSEVKRKIADKLDDYLYDALKSNNVPIEGLQEKLKGLVETGIHLAEHNHEFFAS